MTRNRTMASGRCNVVMGRLSCRMRSDACPCLCGLFSQIGKTHARRCRAGIPYVCRPGASCASAREGWLHYTLSSHRTCCHHVTCSSHVNGFCLLPMCQFFSLTTSIAVWTSQTLIWYAGLSRTCLPGISSRKMPRYMIKEPPRPLSCVSHRRRQGAHEPFRLRP
jgi:hypothetical protein